MKRLSMVALVMILLCITASAEVNIIEFTESTTKRFVAVKPSSDITSAMTGIFFTNTFSTSAGIVMVDDEFIVDRVIFDFDLSDTDTTPENIPFLIMIAGISALEYRGYMDSILKVTGEHPIQEAINLYVYNMERNIAGGIEDAKQGKQVNIYKSNEYEYKLFTSKGKDGKVTGSVRLMAERIK